jgi:hypothetical protein
MLRRIACFAAIALLLVACSTSKATPSSSASNTKPGPFAGRVLFGDSYDKTTFVVSGQRTQAPQGKDMVFVAHFSKPVPSGQIHLLGVLSNGKTVLDHAVTVTNGPWTVYGMKIPGTAISQTTSLLIRVVDDGNVLLSTGTLNLTRAAPSSSAPRSSASPRASGGGAPSPS